MSIDRLSPDDRVMLWPDAVWPQDIGALAILDGRTLLDASGALRIGAVRQAIEARLHLVPRFRQVLLEPRRGLGGPLWVDAPAFDLGDHIQAVALPAPGDEEQLLLAVERLRRRRLDRSRPLWEMWFLTGLSERRVGLFVRLHHVIADGVAGVATVGLLLDAAPDVTAPPSPPWAPVPPPGSRALLADNLRRRVEETGRALSTLSRPVTALKRALGAWPALREIVAEGPARATSLNRLIGPDRRLALVRTAIDEVRDVAHAQDAKVNDVLLTAIAGGVRGLLSNRGEPVEGAVARIYVPVSLRHAQRGGATGNLISQMVVPLPIGMSDPVRRLRRVADETALRKATTRPALGGLFRSRIARAALLKFITRRPVNVTSADIPGPQQPLFLAGAPLLEVFPLVNLIGNVSLGVAGLSYSGRFGIMVVADRDAYPDLEVFAASMREELRALGASAVSASGHPGPGAVRARPDPDV